MTRIRSNRWTRAVGRGAAALFLALLMPFAGGVRGAETGGGSADEPWLRPYAGPTRTDIDATTLDGKVLCGYQGWFNTPDDGTRFGFGHWGSRLDRPGGGRFGVWRLRLCGLRR